MYTVEIHMMLDIVCTRRYLPEQSLKQEKQILGIEDSSESALTASKCDRPTADCSAAHAYSTRQIQTGSARSIRPRGGRA